MLTHQPIITLTAHDDDELSSRLSRWKKIKNTSVWLVLQPNSWRFLFVCLVNGVITEAITGNLGVNTKKLINKWLLSTNGQKFLEIKETSNIPRVSVDNVQLIFDQVISLPTNNDPKATLSSFLKNREILINEVNLVGRKKLSPHVVNWVFARSGGVCELDGCTVELFCSNATFGYTGYLCHIIASSPDGPRGDTQLSTLQEVDPNNLMLCCDKCHRLIDRINPDAFPVEKLQSMVRNREIARGRFVKYLGYPPIQGVAILGNIANVSTSLSEHDAYLAMLDIQKRPFSDRVITYSLRDDHNGNDINDPTYWGHFLYNYKSEIKRLIEDQSNAGQLAQSTAELAVFALGNMPLMILAGRLIGEARPVTIFHFNGRTTKSWRPVAAPIPIPQFSLIAERGKSQEKHVIITIELTASIHEDRIPINLRHFSKIRLVVNTPNTEVVASQLALENFRQKVSECLKLALDEWLSDEISILAIAPAAALFILGQKLMARSHPIVHIYQMPSKGTTPFEALTLTNNSVSSQTIPPEKITFD